MARHKAELGAPTVARGLGALLSAAGLVVLAACGSNTPTSSRSAAAVATSPSTSTTSPSTTAAAAAQQAAATAGAPVVVVGATRVGATVVDQSGGATYTFDRDVAGSGTAACLGACAAVWPPLTAIGTPSAGPGISGSVGVITRTDGKRQVTLNGRPLYEFSGDHAAGDANGDGFGGVWHVARPSGTAAAAVAPGATSAPTAPPASTPRAIPTTPPATTPPTTARPTPPPTAPPTTARPTPPPTPPPTTGGGYHY